MAFTYDLSTNIGQARFHLGDSEENAGVLLLGANFTDEEIQYELDRTGSVGAAVVSLSDVVASRWANAPQSFSADGLSVNRGDVSARWVAKARELRSKFGLTAGVVYLVR